MRMRPRPSWTGSLLRFDQPCSLTSPAGSLSDPGYMQLHASCPVEIRSGADDGSEMGVFHDLFQVQRETNLRARLQEYLRFGLEAGVLFVT